MRTKKFTILHSNDMHGDFLAEAAQGQGKTIGGLAHLSGYLNKVRNEEENVLYVIAGDMLQGSLIDSEWKGVSTIEIMNWLAPDVVAIGNHEVDYGLAHLLFLEKLANFPLVNANLYLTKNHKRLLSPYKILKKSGFDVLFTGIITEKIMDSIKQDALISSFVTLSEASEEVGRICNSYKNDDIDLTILLTHIGYESDLELAELLKPEWGVDMIIGGHSHTILDKPAKANNILIATAGVGTDQIGRFDIVVDDDTNAIVDYTWKLIPINEDLAPKDEALEAFIHSYRDKVDEKYGQLLCHFDRQLMHPKREEETPLGNLIADILAENAGADVMLVGSGSIRVKSLGPAVTMKDFLACFPYDDALTRFSVTGKQLKQIFGHIMRLSNRDGEGECYQVNHRVKAVYNDSTQSLTSLSVDGKPVVNTRVYTLGLQNYHVSSCEPYLGISSTDLLQQGCDKVVTTSIQPVLEEHLRTHSHYDHTLTGRLVYGG
jgi:5'-nucleotidase / UDP-sugar diphosphatase